MLTRRLAEFVIDTDTEDIPAEVELDREALFNLIHLLHDFVENR